MMLSGFVCPNGVKVSLAQCLSSCQMGERCLSLPSLRAIGSVREWTGKPSTTQLLNGTMYSWLQLTREYYIVPESRAFALLGTTIHERLEASGDEEITEESFQDAVKTGTCDLLEAVEGGYLLTDYKTWGSYRVSRFLGLDYELVDDPSGALYQRATTVGGRKFPAGSSKQVKWWFSNPLLAHTRDVELQLNSYRMMAESVGMKIVGLRVQVVVRDGGLQMARERGVGWLMKRLVVNKLPDEEVKEYFGRKSEELLRAMRDGWSEPCSEEERWDDQRCREYCEVAQFCQHGLEVKCGGLSQ